MTYKPPIDIDFAKDRYFGSKVGGGLTPQGTTGQSARQWDGTRPNKMGGWKADINKSPDMPHNRSGYSGVFNGHRAGK